MILQDIKETKCYGHTFVVRSFKRTDRQRENSIPAHKQFAGGINISCHNNQSSYLTGLTNMIYVEANVLRLYAKFQLQIKNKSNK